MTVLLQYLFTGNSASPTTVGTDVEGTGALNLTGGNPDPEVSLTSGSFATDPEMQIYPVTGATSAANAYGAGGYIEFDLAAASGKVLNLTSLTFKGAKNGASTRGWVLRSSVDSYAANLAAAEFATVKPTWSDISIDLSGASYQGLADITFRLCVWGTDNSYSSWLDEITVNGTVDAEEEPPAPAASSALLEYPSTVLGTTLPAEGTIAILVQPSWASSGELPEADAQVINIGLTGTATTRLSLNWPNVKKLELDIGGVALTGDLTFAAGQRLSVVGRWDASKVSLDVDGTEVESAGAPTTGGTIDAIRLGSANGASPYSGGLAQLIVSSKRWTDADVATFQTYRALLRDELALYRWLAQTRDDGSGALIDYTGCLLALLAGDSLAYVVS